MSAAQLLALIIAGPFLLLVLIGIGSSAWRALRERREQTRQRRSEGLGSNYHG